MIVIINLIITILVKINWRRDSEFVLSSFSTDSKSFNILVRFLFLGNYRPTLKKIGTTKRSVNDNNT